MSFPLCSEAVSLTHLQNPCAISLFPSLKLSFAVMAAGIGSRHGSSFCLQFFVLWHRLFPCPLAVGRRVFCPLPVLHCWHKKPQEAGTELGSLVHLSAAHARPLHCAILRATAAVHNARSRARCRLPGSSWEARQVQPAQRAAGSVLGAGCLLSAPALRAWLTHEQQHVSGRCSSVLQGSSTPHAFPKALAAHPNQVSRF